MIFENREELVHFDIRRYCCAVCQFYIYPTFSYLPKQQVRLTWRCCNDKCPESFPSNQRVGSPKYKGVERLCEEFAEMNESWKSTIDRDLVYKRLQVTSGDIRLTLSFILDDIVWLLATPTTLSGVVNNVLLPEDVLIEIWSRRTLNGYDIAGIQQSVVHSQFISYNLAIRFWMDMTHNERSYLLNSSFFNILEKSYMPFFLTCDDKLSRLVANNKLKDRPLPGSPMGNNVS